MKEINPINCKQTYIGISKLVSQEANLRVDGTIRNVKGHCISFLNDRN